MSFFKIDMEPTNSRYGDTVRESLITNGYAHVSTDWSESGFQMEATNANGSSFTFEFEISQKGEMSLIDATGISVDSGDPVDFTTDFSDAFSLGELDNFLEAHTEW